MKRLTQIFQALLGVAALIFTALAATGRLAWRKFGKCSKWFRRSVAAIVIITPVVFLSLFVYACYDSRYGRYSWDDTTLSERIEVHGYRDNKFRVYDKEYRRYITDKISWITSCNDDSIVVYAIPGKRGYINTNDGRIIIDALANDYSRAWIFSEGLAAVMKNGKIGFINCENEVVIPFQYEWDKMQDLGYQFCDGLCVMSNDKKRVGLIDTTGRWVVEPLYDYISHPQANGYRTFSIDDKMGVLDKQCNILIAPEYENIRILADGYIFTRDGRKWKTDFEGNIVNPYMFDGTYYLKYPVGYNEAGEMEFRLAEYMKYTINDCCGLMNRITGEIITPAIYSEINMLSSELFEVIDYDNYHWYFIDSMGRIIPRK